MSFFLYIVQMMTILTVRIDWINDYIRVPVFDHIEEYRYLPEAKLYIDDFLVVGANVEYERNGVEWTFISTVNTNQVRRYQIKYRAYFPDYHLSDIRSVTFDVVDETNPTIITIPDKRMNIGDKMPDLIEGVVVSDNYYKPEEILIHVDTSKVLTNVVGIYPVIYRISDPSANVVTREVLFEVIDPLPPVITLKQAVKLNINAPFDWSNFFTIKDNVDIVLRIEVDDQKVFYNKVGVYQAKLTATDDSGNNSVELFTIEIADLEKPVLRLQSKPRNITVFQVIDRELLESYILEVRDNYDEISLSDVKITHDIEHDVLGTYSIYFELSDQSGNKVESKLLVKVDDDIKPIIEIITPLVFSVFSVEPFYHEHFQFKDNFTDSDDLVYKINTSPKMNVVGRYPITVEVSDSSGNKAIYQGYVQIVDSIPPLINQLNEIVITGFERKELKHYFSFSDQYDKTENITYIFHDENVNYDVVGSYEAYVKAYDQSQNESIFSFEIMIIDMIEPTLKIKQNYYLHDVGKSEVNMVSFIDFVEDNYDSLSFEDVIITNEIIWDKIGKYEVSFSLTDQSLNQTTHVLTFVIDDRIPPTIVFEDLMVLQGEIIRLEDGIEVSDNYGKPNIYTFPETISTDDVGTYVVTYVVVDERGNYRMVDRLITILPNDDPYPLTSWIPLGILLIAGFSILYVLYKRG